MKFRAKFKSNKVYLNIWFGIQKAKSENEQYSFTFRAKFKRRKDKFNVWFEVQKPQHLDVTALKFSCTEAAQHLGVPARALRRSNT